MKETRIGIVGMGKMGVLHASILNSLSDTKVVAVTDTEKFVTSFLSSVPEIEVYNDYKKMSDNSKLDAVYITTPVISHVPIASYFAKKGVSFFIEKPVGINLEECGDLCQILKDTEIISMVGYYLRYAETFSKAKELLDNNTIGKIASIKSSVYQSQALSKASGWRFKKETSGGGVLIDLGSHLIDLLLWYFGNIKKVEGKVASHYLQEVEDSARAKIFFDNGINCSFEASWNVNNYRLQETTIEIDGTLGKMKINEDYLMINYHQPNEEQQDATLYRQSLYSGVPIDVGGPEYTREDVDFLNCIRNKKQPISNVVNSCKTQSVIDSVYKSAKNKSVEEVTYIE